MKIADTICNRYKSLLESIAMKRNKIYTKGKKEVNRFYFDAGLPIGSAETPWEMRSLSPIVKDKNDPRNKRHVFRLKLDLDVVASWFGRKKVGIQYKTSIHIQELINNGNS